MKEEIFDDIYLPKENDLNTITLIIIIKIVD